MSLYKLKYNEDKTITVLGLKHKPSGVVLNPSLSLHLLMKYPRLGRGKIVDITPYTLMVDIDNWSDKK